MPQNTWLGLMFWPTFALPKQLNMLGVLPGWRWYFITKGQQSG
jgi:hypothetical protein